MSNTIHLNGNDKTAKTLATASFPSYKGKKFKVNVVPVGHKFSLTSGWSGGSRDWFVIVRLSDMRAIDVSEMVGNEFNRNAVAHQLQDGFMLVEHSMFQGTDLGLTFYITEANATKFLPAPVELTEAERKVLKATRSYKSSYGGNNNVRRDNSGLSIEVWNATVEILKEKKLLAKNGSITIEGKNAVGSAL